MNEDGEWKNAFSFGYSTVKSVRIRSWRIGLLYYSLSLGILTYVGVYVLWWQRGYQTQDSVEGTIVCKLKGSASDPLNPSARFSSRVWDAADLVEYTANGFFIPTSMLVTTQGPGYCTAGNKTSDLRMEGVWTESCNGNFSCQEGMRTFSGTQTGKCITDGSKKTLRDGGKAGKFGICSGGSRKGEACFGNDDKSTCAPGGGKCYGAFCEVKSWCPIEMSVPNASQKVSFNGFEDFSVFARIDVMYSKFNLRHNNVPDGEGLCSLDDFEDGECEFPNQFPISTLLERANVSIEEAMLTGAEIVVSAVWSDTGDAEAYYCDLDHDDWRTNCKPYLTFRRLDDPDPRTFSHGYNYRSSRVFSDQGTDHRDLRKLTGIKVLFIVEGQGGRFDAMITGTTVGSGLALLSVATLVSLN